MRRSRDRAWRTPPRRPGASASSSLGYWGASIPSLRHGGSPVIGLSSSSRPGRRQCHNVGLTSRRCPLSRSIRKHSFIWRMPVSTSGVTRMNHRSISRIRGPVPVRLLRGTAISTGAGKQDPGGPERHQQDSPFLGRQACSCTSADRAGTSPPLIGGPRLSSRVTGRDCRRNRSGMLHRSERKSQAIQVLSIMALSSLS